MSTTYTAVRWNDDGDPPEVYLHEGLWEAVAWLLDFHGMEDEPEHELDQIKEQLGRFRQVDLEKWALGIHLVVLPLAVGKL